MKRKIVTLLLAGTMIFSLAACGAEDTSQENNNGNVQTIQEPEQDTEEMADAEEQNEAVDSGTVQNTYSNILIAYFSIPELCSLWQNPFSSLSEVIFSVLKRKKHIRWITIHW